MPFFTDISMSIANFYLKDTYTQKKYIFYAFMISIFIYIRKFIQEEDIEKSRYTHKIIVPMMTVYLFINIKKKYFLMMICPDNVLHNHLPFIFFSTKKKCVYVYIHTHTSDISVLLLSLCINDDEKYSKNIFCRYLLQFIHKIRRTKRMNEISIQ